MNIQQIKKKALPILKREGVVRAALFGSIVRGEAKKRSDIDMIVKFKKGKSLLDLVGLQLDLQDALGKKVDLLTYGGIHPLLKDAILSEQKIIYEKRS